MAVEDRVRSVVEPIVDDLALELVDLTYGGGRLRITIDHVDGLDSERLTQATRLISHELDLTDPISGSYTLEVSSPGVERPLRTPAHYLRSVGEQVSLKLYPGDDGVRRLRGELTEAGESGVTIHDGDESHEVPYDRISKAKTVFDWGPAPKPGKAKKQSSGAGGAASRKAQSQ